MTSVSSPVVVAKAPAKINLILRVGQPDHTGYHPLTTVFQALDMWDEVAVQASDSDRLDLKGPGNISAVPTDSTNIVWRAVDALANHTGFRHPLHITIHKTIPVAGGMAGGSADAAATLVATNKLWQLGLKLPELEDLARTLGADVPFSLRGGLALGQGRGDILTSLTRDHDLHCVVVTSDLTLSTPLVYRELDKQRGALDVPLPGLTEKELTAVSGDPSDDFLESLVNDLQPAAVALAPTIRGTLDALQQAGAVMAMVSGSGPTVWGMCRDASHARDVAHLMRDKGFQAHETQSTPLGAHLISPLSSPTEGR